MTLVTSVIASRTLLQGMRRCQQQQHLQRTVVRRMGGGGGGGLAYVINCFEIIAYVYCVLNRKNESLFLLLIVFNIMFAFPFVTVILNLYDYFSSTFFPQFCWLENYFKCSTEPAQVSKFHKYGGEFLQTVMWVWVFHRARLDGAVLLGWKHPWDH
jgi:hypothetical protein